VTKLLQTLMDSVAVGSLYALIALGYTMVYGILKFINFAHSDIFMLGAWLSFSIAMACGFSDSPPWYAAPFVLTGSMLLCGALGFTIERLAYRPLRSAPRINVLITAIGISLLIENCGQLDPKKPTGLDSVDAVLKWIASTGIRFPFGNRPERMPTLLPDTVLVEFVGVQLRLVDVLVVTIALGLMAALQWLIFGTKLGRAMRAVSYDTRTAALMGIDVDRVISITFVVGSMLAAAAGFLFSQKYPGINQPAHSTWILLGLKAFVAAVIGGIGNIRGAMAGGLLIGFVELFGAAYFSPQLRDVYVFSLLILVLLIRPEGLLGKATVEKV